MGANSIITFEVSSQLEIDKEKKRNPEGMYKAYLEAMQNKKK